MFGRHKIEIKLVKNNSQESNETTAPAITTEDVQRVAKNVVKYVVVGTAALMAAATVLDTASKIIVNKSTKEDTND